MATKPDSKVQETESDYEAPALHEYGTIEEWTLGRVGSQIQISIVL